MILNFNRGHRTGRGFHLDPGSSIKKRQPNWAAFCGLKSETIGIKPALPHCLLIPPDQLALLLYASAQH